MTDIAAQPVILITMQNLLIAKDIEQTIQEAWPNAEVITAAGIAAAEEAIATRPQIDIAFLEPPTTAAFLLATRGMARLAGFEPATVGLEGRCSIRMSYRRTRELLSHRHPVRPSCRRRERRSRAGIARPIGRGRGI